MCVRKIYFWWEIVCVCDKESVGEIQRLRLIERERERERERE